MRQHDIGAAAAAFSPRARPFPAFLIALVAFAVGIQGVTELVRARRLSELGLAGAKWIWVAKSPDPAPVHFSAIREFRLDAVPKSADARVFVDRRFQLWVNGNRAGAGGQKPGDPLQRFDVGALLRPGQNTVAIVAESSAGIGGILFALSPESGSPILVSDRFWTVDPTGLEIRVPTKTRAVVLGRPPMQPWRWPGAAPGTGGPRDWRRPPRRQASGGTSAPSKGSDATPAPRPAVP